MALITTVLPTFRRPQWLARALHSVLAQTEPDFEVCVYDNASGDRTEEIVRTIAARDARVKYYCHPVNLGPMENFRFGVARVTTPYLNILSDDDLLCPKFFERTLAGFREHPEAMLSMGLLRHVNTDGQLLAIPLSSWDEGIYRAPQGALRWAAKGDTWTSIMFRREVLQLTGGIEPDVGLEADFDFVLRALAAAAMVLIKQPLASFTIHERSAMSTGSIEQLIAGMRRIENRVAAMELPDNATRDQLRRAVYAANASRLFRFMMKLALRGMREETNPAIHELRVRFRQPARALALSLVASPSKPGSFARRVIKLSYDLRRRFRELRFGVPNQLNGCSLGPFGSATTGAR